MRKKILLFLFAGLGLFGQAQAQSSNSTINPKIAAVYGSSLNSILAQDPQRLALLNQLLNERIQIMDLDAATAMDKFPALNNQPLFNKYVPGLSAETVYNPNTFNPLKYDLPFFNYGDVGFWINGTNKVLLIRGMRNFIN
ncbi:hypothetical protein DBR32_08540 [Taibaiella sp. KBW10]|uniref:hypothetical protein n=1 Tax=Taibaiella sp. KBW10 TaxID=2153357 RepID=UPI000F5AFBFC|nr:hypothetical protein [Taibaiella sp. KBW10]RQO30765.1 hypothetical protein DBR32_08540 [Taibaiella sp. KBW10]